MPRPPAISRHGAGIRETTYAAFGDRMAVEEPLLRQGLAALNPILVDR